MAQDVFLSVEYFLSSREQRKRLSGNRLRFIKSGQSANSLGSLLTHLDLTSVNLLFLGCFTFAGSKKIKIQCQLCKRLIGPILPFSLFCVLGHFWHGDKTTYTWLSNHMDDLRGNLLLATEKEDFCHSTSFT